eukprot:5757171-Amphidinium_carterae.1
MDVEGQGKFDWKTVPLFTVSFAISDICAILAGVNCLPLEKERVLLRADFAMQLARLPGGKIVANWK